MKQALIHTIEQTLGMVLMWDAFKNGMVMDGLMEMKHKQRLKAMELALRYWGKEHFMQHQGLKMEV